jgi:hypothetical protein
MKEFIKKLMFIFAPKAEKEAAPVVKVPVEEAAHAEETTPSTNTNLADIFYEEASALAKIQHNKLVDGCYQFIINICEQRKKLGAMECQFQIGSTEDWPHEIKVAVITRLRKDGFEVKTFYGSYAIQEVSWGKGGEINE